MSVDKPAGLFRSKPFTRRQHIQGLAGLAYAAAAEKARAANRNVAYGQLTIPAGIRSRFAENVNGLRCIFWKQASKAKIGPVFCCCTASRNSPTVGEK